MDAEKRREWWLLGGFVAALVCVILICAHFSYRIEPDRSNLKECIAAFYNQKLPEWRFAKEIRVHGSIELGDRVYCLTEIDGELGRAILKKSIAGRYKIEQLSTVSHDFLGGMVEEDGRSYLVYGGRNLKARIAEIHVEVDEVRYSLTVPEGDYFFVYTEMNHMRKAEYRWGPEALAFDAEGKDITDEIGFCGSGV